MSENDDLIIVRDRRRRRFWVADNLIVDHYLPIIGDKGLTLYSLLCRLASDKLEMARPGYVLLCEHTGWSRSTVWAYRRLLEVVGLVEVVSGGGRRTNVYYLLDVQALDLFKVAAISERVEREYKNGFQRQVLERLQGWRPLQARFQDAPKKRVQVADQPGFEFYDETTPFHGETGSRDDETTPFHGETRSTISGQELEDKKKEQEAITTGPADGKSVVVAAMIEAGILAVSHGRLLAAWPDMTAEDVLAWREYVHRENVRRPGAALGPGFIVAELSAKHTAPAACYLAGADDVGFTFIN